MTEGYIGWALMVGLALGGALVWFAVGRLPRSAEDVTPGERASEAALIADQLRQRGQRLPPDQIEQVLALHADYLADALPPDYLADSPPPA
jgi:hypothetical protein